MTEQDKSQKVLGLDPVQANALFAWQHGILVQWCGFLPHVIDVNLLPAFRSVKARAKEVGMTRNELKQVPIDRAWISEELLEKAGLA